jgi:type IV secretion system protein VirB1
MSKTMLLAAITLAQLLRDCAPSVSPKTMTAIVRVESGGNSLALRDNSLGRAFAPGSTAEAVAWANQLLAMGHSLDLGLSQVNSANLPMLGLTVRAAFDPCTNLQAGATILGADYRNAAQHFGTGQYALRRAIGAYNSGSLYAGQDYVNEILAAAGLAPETGYVPDIQAATGSESGSLPPGVSAPKAKAKRGIPGTDATPGPAYTIQRTPGSSVTVLVGN